MIGVHVSESVGNDGRRMAEVSGPEYVSCHIVPAPNRPSWYLRETLRRSDGPVERHWYPSYDEAVAAAVNYAGQDVLGHLRS